MAGCGRQPGARCDPSAVGLERQTELLVKDAQIPVATAHDSLGRDRLHFLRQDTDIGLVAAIVAEAIETKSVVEMAEEHDTVLERNIGSTSATTTPSAAT